MVFTTEIKLPNNVQVTQQSHFVMFQGPLGINKISLKKIDTKGIGAIHIKQYQAHLHEVWSLRDHPTLTEIHKNQMELRIRIRIIVSSPSKSFCGLVSTIIKNKIQGVSRGFLIYIRV